MPLQLLTLFCLEDALCSSKLLLHADKLLFPLINGCILFLQLMFYTIAFAEYLAMTSQLNDLGIEIERNCNAHYGEIVYINYFYSSMLSTALNHVVREMVTKYQSGDFDDDLYQMQYQDSLQTFDVPIEDAR